MPIIRPTSRGKTMAEAINKIIERLPEARFLYVCGPRLHGQFRLAIQGQLYWVKYVNSFVVEPEEQLGLALYERMPENDLSKAIENRLNGIGPSPLESAKITAEDLAFTINCTKHHFNRGSVGAIEWAESLKQAESEIDEYIAEMQKAIYPTPTVKNPLTVDGAGVQSAWETE
jgi:hypothetical protein